MKHPIPDAALAQHTAILGKTGSGKTITAKGIVERILRSDPGARVCVLDPIKSDWWGLTSNTNGRGPGLPFHILGGPRGHVPLHHTAGRAIGELVASGALPLSIVDMADFGPGGLQSFFNDFAPALLRGMRGVIHLVWEEAHEFAPKERAGHEGENMTLYHAKKIATAGRSKGIRLIVATQATQLLHNRVLGSCETMVVQRLTAPADQKPVKDWLKANMDKATYETVANSLASLKTGAGWLCSGELKLAELVEFPPLQTYDNSRTPAASDRAQEVKTAPVDKERLRSIIGAAVAEAEASDVPTLRKRIHELEAAAAKKSAAGPAVDLSALETARQAGYRDGYRTGRMHAFGRADGDLITIDRALADLRMGWTAEKDGPLPEGFGGGSEEATTARNRSHGIVGAARAETIPPLKAHSTDVSLSRWTTSPPNGQNSSTVAEGLQPREQRVLDAVAWWAATGVARPTRVQVAAVAGYSAKGGGFLNLLSALKTKGLTDSSGVGTVGLTASGKSAANHPMTVPTTDELHSRVRAILEPRQWKVLEVVIGCYPQSISRDDLAKATSYAPDGGGYLNLVSSLKSLGFINSPARGQVVALPILFVER